MGKNSKQRRDLKRKNSKRKLNIQKSINNKNESYSGPLIQQISNPFAELSEDDMQEVRAKLENVSKEHILDSFKYLSNCTREYDPIDLISIMSTYSLIAGINENGIQTNISSHGIQQAHLELFQAIILQIPEGELGYRPPVPDIISTTIEKLKSIPRDNSFSRINDHPGHLTNKKQAEILIQERLRGHTQNVRNWGYHSQIVSVCKEIYLPFDDLLINKLGFTASNIIAVFSGLLNITQNNINSHLKKLIPLMSIKQPFRLLTKYLELIGQEISINDYKKNFPPNITTKQMLAFCMSHHDLRLKSCYKVDFNQLSKSTNIEKSIIKKIIHFFSYSLGELKPNKTEYFLLDNPIWKKPVMSVKHDFYCPLPQVFFSFALNTLDSVIEEYDKKSLHERRANYLEQKIESIVKGRFPDSHIISGLKWKHEDVLYETDLIAFIDSHAIIIEAKSNKIAPPVLRGSLSAAKQHVQRIFVKPSQQSLRLAKKISEIKQGKTSSNIFLESLPIDINKINKVIRISVSLEDFATLQSNMDIFNDAGWLPKDLELCPTINLGDFETLFDLLEHPIQIIHYLQRRTEMNNIVKFIGDEVDFMGLYLSTLFNLESFTRHANEPLFITGMSEPIDKYYMAKDEGIILHKPQPQISPLFKEILQFLEYRNTYRWSEIGCILSYFPPDLQSRLTKEIKKLSKRVNKNWKIDGHENTLIYQPPASSEYALAIVLFKDNNKSSRNEFIHNSCELGLELEHVKHCLVIAINIDDKKTPYSCIALFDKQTQSA